VKLEFTYTPEDVKEMARAAQKVMYPRRRRGLVGWALFVALATVLYLLLQRTGTPRSQSGPMPTNSTPAASPEDNILFSLAPWLLVFAAVLVIFIWWARVRLAKRLWETHPSLQQPQTLAMSDSGVTMTSPMRTSTWDWLVFVAVIETERLLLLQMIDKGMFLMIPKRAAGDAASVDELRAYLQAHVQRQLHGFPVIPATSGPSQSQ